ncbi:MAG TPA: RpiB/LacA/LacB family sugar-phosphate isomerase [Candidatus Levybacteria bacterium]|mgnify:CR=1 FL=1|nr:RpiB/LacA/LacB family sugar-phosphate isomerase [Candidatus Levybacteria bacterium]
MKVILGADHRGFALKQTLKQTLTDKGYEVVDAGNTTLDEADDYPDFASQAAYEVMQDSNNRGIVICGSGVGVCITANKVKGIRCGLGMTQEQVKSARLDDDITMLALAADYLDTTTAQSLVDTFLTTDFEAKDSHTRRIDKISKIEQS